MMDRRRALMMAQGDIPTSPPIEGYIGTGLVALFDGKTNAGVGVARRTTGCLWTDLVSGTDGRPVRSPECWSGSDYFWHSSNWDGHCVATIENLLDISKPFTIEVRCASTSLQGSNVDRGATAFTMNTSTNKSNAGAIEFRIPYPYEGHGMTAYIGDAEYDFGQDGYVQTSMHTYTARRTGNNIDFYADGVFCGSKILQSSLSPEIYERVSIFTDRATDWAPANGRRFHGQGACFRVYKRAISASEIDANYQNDLVRFGL